MSNFLWDLLTTPKGKSNGKARKNAATEAAADEWERLCTGLEDQREAYLNGELRQNPLGTTTPSASGAIRTRVSAAGKLELSQNGSSFEKVVKVFDVTAYGATGVGPTHDDLAGIQAAYAAAKAAGGGVVHFPMPTSGGYYTSAPFIAGQQWIDPADVKYVSGGAWDPWAAPSYNNTKHTAYYNEKVVSFQGDPGVEIRAMFSAGPIMVYGIAAGDVPGFASGFIRGLSFVGPGGWSGTSAVFPPGDNAVTGTNVGLCLLGAQVHVEGVSVRDCDRGVVGFDAEWALLEKVIVKRSNRGFELLQFNAGRMHQCVATYAHAYGLVVAGQGFAVDSFSTEQAKCAIWVPGCDQAHIDGRYLESLGSEYNDYLIRLGDPAAPGNLQALHVQLSNIHGSTEFGQHIYLHAAPRVMAVNCRLYPGSNDGKSLVHDIYSSLIRVNCSLPMDPASAGDSYDVADQASSTVSGVVTIGAQTFGGNKSFAGQIDAPVLWTPAVLGPRSNAALQMRGTTLDSTNAVATVVGASQTLTGANARLLQITNGMDVSPQVKFGIDVNGKHVFSGYTDTSGTPGAATANTVTGRSALAAGASSVVITNSTVTAASIVHPVFEDLDTTATGFKVVASAGSFTVTANAAATAAVKFKWTVTN